MAKAKKATEKLPEEIIQSNDAPPFTPDNTELMPAQSTELAKVDEVKHVGNINFSVKEADIAELKKKSDGLTIKSLDDKESIKSVRVLKSESRKMRTTTEAERKKAKEEILAAGRFVDQLAKDRFELIAGIEGPMDVELEKLEKWEAEEAERIEAEKQKEINRRIDVLGQAGMVFNGMMYAIGNVRSMDKASIQALSLEDFDRLVSLVISDKKKLDDDAEKERLEEVERLRLEKEAKEKFEAEQEKLRIEKEAFEKEKAEMKKQKTDMRKQRLAIMGMKENVTVGFWYFQNDFFSFKITSENVHEMPDVEFSSLTNDNAPKIQEALDMEAKEIQRQAILAKRTDDRKQYLTSLGLREFGNHWNIASHDFALKQPIGNSLVVGMEEGQWDLLMIVLKAEIAKLKEEKRIKDEKVAQDKEDEEERKENEKRIYNFRCEDLIGLGMKLGQLGYGYGYVYVNKYGQHTSITFDEIKGKENWKECIATITEAISILKQKETDETNRLAALELAKKPQITKVREYASSVLAIVSPEIEDVKLKEILLTLKEKITTAIGSANRSLLEYEK